VEDGVEQRGGHVHVDVELPVTGSTLLREIDVVDSYCPAPMREVEADVSRTEFPVEFPPIGVESVFA